MGPQPHQPTLTIDTYQPPDPTKPQHRMARPIITPVKPQSKAKTTQTTTTSQSQRDRRVTHSRPTNPSSPPLPPTHPTIPNDTPKNGSLNETEPNPPHDQITSHNQRNKNTHPHTLSMIIISNQYLRPTPSPLIR